MEIILLICSAILLLVTPSIEVTTSCNIPNAELGQPTNLTCKFSEDIKTLRRDFKVELYLNNQTESTVTVLDCHWFNGALECETHECCTFDKNVSDSIQVHFRRITSKYVGKYVCFVLPASIGSSEFCNFMLKENFITTALPPKQLAHAEKTASPPGEGLAALVIIPIAIIIIVVAIVCYKKKGLRKKAADCLTCKRGITGKGNRPSNIDDDIQKKVENSSSKMPTGLAEQSKHDHAEENKNGANNVKEVADSKEANEEERRPLLSNESQLSSEVISSSDNITDSSKSRTLPKTMEHPSAITKLESSKSHTLPNKGENSTFGLYMKREDEKSDEHNSSSTISDSSETQSLPDTVEQTSAVQIAEASEETAVHDQTAQNSPTAYALNQEHVLQNGANASGEYLDV